MEMYLVKFKGDDNETILYVPVYANSEFEANNKAHYVLFQSFDDMLRGREGAEDWSAYDFVSCGKYNANN